MEAPFLVIVPQSFRSYEDSRLPLALLRRFFAGCHLNPAGVRRKTSVAKEEAAPARHHPEDR